MIIILRQHSALKKHFGMSQNGYPLLKVLLAVKKKTICNILNVNVDHDVGGDIPSRLFVPYI